MNKQLPSLPFSIALSIAASLLLSFTALTAQTFNQTFNQPNLAFDVSGRMKTTEIGSGYKVQNITLRLNTNNYEMLDVETDFNGNFEASNFFQKYYGNSGFIERTADGRFVRYSVVNGTNVLYAKESAIDDTIFFSKSVVPLGSTTVNSVSLVENAASGFFLAGSMAANGVKGIYVFKTNANGDVLWHNNDLIQTSFGYNFMIGHIVPMPDGGVTVVYRSSLVTSNDEVMVRYGNAGNLIFKKSIAGGGPFNGTSVTSVVADAAGNIYYYKKISYPTTVTNTVFKLDGNGNELWQRALTSQYTAGSLMPLSNGELLVCEDVFSMAKLSGQGDILWSNYNYGFEASVRYLLKTSDGGFLISGLRDGFLWLMKTDANGNVNSTPPATCAGNLLANPGFESGLTDWNPQGNATIISTAHTGTKAVKLGGTGYASIGQAFPTSPGTSYTAKVWARDAGYFQMRFLNASWQQILGSTISAIPTSGIYQELILSNIAPAGAAYVYIFAYKDGSQNMDLDDFCLTSGGTTNYPDLVPSNLTVPATITHGTAFTYSFVAKNNGTAASAATNFKVTLSGNVVAYHPLQALQPNQQVTISKTMTLPQGYYYGSGGNFSVSLDDSNSVQELTENNNQVNTTASVVQGTGGLNLSDLSPSNLVASPNATPQNTPVTITYTRSNLGTAPIYFNAQPHIDYVYLSTDNLLDANDGLLEGGPTPFITPIGTLPGSSFSFTVPNGTIAGNYFLILKTDADDQVPEQNENNNTTSVPFTVTTGTGPCGVVGTLESIECYDNQTPTDPSDDQYCVTVNATYTGAGCSSFFTYNQENFPYGSSITVCGFPANGTPPSLLLQDSANPSAQTTVTAQPPAGCSNAGGTCPGNLFNNPGFETGTVSGWNTGGGFPQTSSSIVSDAHSGNYALTLRQTNFSQQIQVVPGKQYTVRAWCKITGPTYQTAYLAANVFGQTGPVAGGGLTYITSTNYQEYTLAFVAPANAVTASFHITASGADLFATVDDFCVTESTPTCAITASASNVQCHDNGTASLATDDYFTYDFTAQKTGDCGTGWFVGSVVETTYAYGSVQTTGPQSISNGPSQLGIHDATIQNVTYTLTVQPPPTCSNGGGGSGQIDLSLLAQQLTANPIQWNNYPVKLTLSNAGPQAATGVKVKFAKPTGVVYVGGNSHTASQGTFNPNGDEVWTVGSIPANGSATLTVNYFLLNATAPVAYAQVTAANETDADSQPNNGTPPTPVQDDEASTSGGTPPPAADFVATPSSIISFGINQISGSTPSRRFGFNFVGQNTGTAVPVGPGATPVTVAFYLSADNALGASDHALGNFTLSSSNGLTFGNQADLQPIADNVPGGTYYLIAKMDDGNLFAEPNETNNVAVYGQQVVLPNLTNTPQPDLTIADLQIPSASATVGAILNYNFDASNAGTAPVPGNFTIKSYISTDQTLSANDIQDGTIPTGNYAAGFSVQNVAGASSIPANLAAGQYYLIVKIDADNAIAEGNENNNVVVKPFTVTAGGGGTPNCNAISITSGANKITIAGFSAPHVLIKVFRPNWTVAYECLDGACANPTVVTGLGTGSHFVEVKLMNAAWGEICKKTQTVGVTNIQAEQDERLCLVFDRIYPNPTAFLTTMELYSPVEQAATLDFYDRTGRLVHTLEVQLDKGQNLIEQLVFDWKSGTYNVVARGRLPLSASEGGGVGLPAYGRFLKVWEE